MRLAQVAIDFLLDRADFDTWWFSIKPETQADIKSALDEALERHVKLNTPTEPRLGRDPYDA